MHDARSLFENDLGFQAAHRGTVSRRDGFVLVRSTRAEFTRAFAVEDASLAKLPPEYRTVRLLPQSGIDHAALEAAGFSKAVEFSYMSRDTRDLSFASPRESIAIEVVTTPEQMVAFSRVQTLGFLEPQESFDRWFGWLDERNQAGLARADQMFYLARSGGAPAGVTLTVLTGSVAGIYAVATLPEQRNKGVSSALLARAIRDARDRGARTMTLQVKRGSYAESLYEKLGFTLAFTSPAYVRPAP